MCSQRHNKTRPTKNLRLMSFGDGSHPDIYFIVELKTQSLFSLSITKSMYIIRGVNGGIKDDPAKRMF